MRTQDAHAPSQSQDANSPKVSPAVPAPTAGAPSPPAPPHLREDLKYTVHQQQRDLWYAVQDPLTGKFLRLGRREYLLATAMNGRRQFPEIIAALQVFDPDLSATEADVQQLATWLAKAGMLKTENAPVAKPSHRKIVVNMLYTRVPLLDGPPLEQFARWFLPLVNPAVIAIAIIAWLWGTASVLLNWDEFIAGASKLFVPDGRLWWLVAWLVLKSAHELGHAVMAVKVGSQIRAAGISFIFFAPVPYVDISDLWTISNRWQRMLCSAGGILFELTISAIAAIVAVNTTHESLQYFCCAVATLGTVTTLAFNANPLVRFDGYFILSDLLDRPNLWTDGQQAVKRLLGRIFKPFRPASGKLNPALVLYGLGCYQYRIAMLLSLAIWAVLVWQGFGIAMVAWGAYAMLLAPWFKARAAARQQAAMAGPTPAPATNTPWYLSERVWGWAIASGLVLLVIYIPSPVQPSVPGVISLQNPVTLRAEAEGFLQSVLVPVGQPVRQGDVIAVLHNPQLELDFALKSNEIAREQESIQAKRARGELAALQSHQARLASLQTQVAQLVNQIEGLQVRAPVDGALVQHDLHRQLGQLVTPGTPLGLIAIPDALEVHLSASQPDAERLRASLGQAIRLVTANGEKGKVGSKKWSPAARTP
jgi:putative peptide zinc metalloprotease protein